MPAKFPSMPDGKNNMICLVIMDICLCAIWRMVLGKEERSPSRLLFPPNVLLLDSSVIRHHGKLLTASPISILKIYVAVWAGWFPRAPLRVLPSSKP